MQTFRRSLDQVLIANIDHSRLSDVKATFIIGVNEGVIPAAPMDEGMLSDEERECSWRCRY